MVRHGGCRVVLELVLRLVLRLLCAVVRSEQFSCAVEAQENSSVGTLAAEAPMPGGAPLALWVG